MKELDPATTRVLRWVENIQENCRLRHIVVWIGGDEDRAERWSDAHAMQVAVVPADSSDLFAWNVDPQYRCSIVFVENKLAIGGLANVGTQTELDFRLRVKRLGEAALAMKHGHARMWGRVVGRGLNLDTVPELDAPPAVPTMPDPSKL